MGFFTKKMDSNQQLRYYKGSYQLLTVHDKQSDLAAILKYQIESDFLNLINPLLLNPTQYNELIVDFNNLSKPVGRKNQDYQLLEMKATKFLSSLQLHAEQIIINEESLFQFDPELEFD